MGKIGLNAPTPLSYYSVYEMEKTNDPLAYFDSLTGGDQKISMVSYNVTDDKGNVTTKFIPGQTSFDPVVLSRAMDKYSQDMYDAFVDSVAGKLIGLRKNYSVSMNDSQGNPLVWWHLYNALPLNIGGFGFNAYTGAKYTKFKISFQAESIEIEFES
jgi:phage tail-like protein